MWSPSSTPRHLPAEGHDYEICSGSGDNVKVSTVRDSQEQLDAFGARLGRFSRSLVSTPASPRSSRSTTSSTGRRQAGRRPATPPAPPPECPTASLNPFGRRSWSDSSCPKRTTASPAPTVAAAPATDDPAATRAWAAACASRLSLGLSCRRTCTGRTRVARPCNSRRNADTRDGWEPARLGANPHESAPLLPFMVRGGRRFESVKGLRKGPANGAFSFGHDCASLSVLGHGTRRGKT
jgi:hypothetical protein